MIKLGAKLESFIAMMHRESEFARYGFNLLSKRPDPERYFDAISDAQFFDPKNNSGPVPSTEPGFVQIPFWGALDYLGAVAKRADQLNDLELANKIMTVIRNVTNYRDANGEVRDNYHTFHKFAEIFGILPVAVITISDIQLVRIWLTSKFDNSLVGSALSEGLLKKLVRSKSSEDTEKACQLMKECLSFRWATNNAKSSDDLITAIDDYWLREIIDQNAKQLGARAGLQAVDIFLDGLRSIFSDDRRSFGSSFWRPAVEDHEQNMDFRGPENRFVEGTRDAIAGWLEINPEEGIPFIARSLRDNSEIIRRLAIHTVTEHFENLREVFEAAIEPTLFTSGHVHELYRLLRQHFGSLSKDGKDAVLSSLRDLSLPDTLEDRERRLKWMQRDWLSAIKDQPEASEWYNELLSDHTLGPLGDHPDFSTYHETWAGPGPSPFAREALVAFAEEGTLVTRLNEFKEASSWKGPTLGGLLEALEGAVLNSPNPFLAILASLHEAKLPFRHAIIAGFKRLFELSDQSKQEFDWDAAWPKLINYFTESVDDLILQPDNQSDNPDRTPSRGWMVTLIADFLQAGTKVDKSAYAPELLPQGWMIITKLLARAPEDDKANLTDPMTHALNTEKGRLICAMYNHALRVCRVAKQKGLPIEVAWHNLQDAFDTEISKCREANFDFSTLSASYIGNLEFMSHNWLAANVAKLFPATKYPTNFAVALGGLAFARPTRQIYKMLADNAVFDNALKLDFNDQHSRERIIQWVSLGYLWGETTLDAPLFSLIFAAGVDDLQEVADFFWSVRGEKLTSDQVEKILAFWRKCLSWCTLQDPPPAKFHARLSRLSPYLKELDSDAEALLLATAPYAHSDHLESQMIEELARFVDANPSSVAKILERMLDEHTPNHDHRGKLKNLIGELAAKGLRNEAIHSAERLRASLPGMIDFYKELIARAK
ncbi:hypothetical protein V1290_004242 [Bradyrhizobium sp. AZCC 1578]|uniref:hypothetical protein n=1 Tax=Bradyrhizobium sp. AZCC 1578 TaxID=3117027 RepID=UPI002FF41324